ncbi:DUF3365 domain-containing protein [Geobacter sp. DSM 9736]|uniref:Tll0287-like domain-containing protein n=1 Tax=Geobacter sp. DSM 9736 TaxID=1277350 RepID=UPI000B4FD8CE|nr:DUF3365 domain-containing protein [Geobacter sp. DSM 9736]SNB47171.1 Protein of unknown function [Geobacter sp. DSM 9736]
MVRKFLWSVGVIAIGAGLFFTTTGVLRAGEREESISTAVVEYLIAGRGVIARNQPLINDASKGNKGFTAEVYENQLKADFFKRTGIDITALTASDPFNKALLDVHNSAKEVVTAAQSQINEPNKGFKGFNPAVFGARVGANLSNRSGIQLKQTSIKFRGDYNRPDEFETAVLKGFEGKKDPSHYEEVTVAGRKFARYMVPVYIEKSCLTCHGDPAGSLDISGRVKEGYREGDLRGAISVMIPFD